MSDRKVILSFPLALTMVLWAFNFVAVKLAYREVTPPALAVSRTVATYLILVVVCALRREPLGYPRQDALRLLSMGFVASGIYMVSFLEGMQRTSPAEAAIILATSPLFVMLLSALHGMERLSFGAMMGAVVSLLGVGLVVGPSPDGFGSHLTGNLLILLGSALWAYGVILAKPLSEAYSPYRVFMLSLPGALVAILPYGLVATLTLDWSGVQPINLAMVGYVTLFAGAVAFTAFYHGVRQVGPTGAMLYQYSVPPMAAVISWFVLGIPVSVVQAVGMVTVFAGLTWAWRVRAAAGRLEARQVESALEPTQGEVIVAEAQTPRTRTRQTER